jgi:yecA family protein
MRKQRSKPAAVVPRLTVEELKRLEELHDKADDEGRTICPTSLLHGFFSALACSPSRVPLEEWMAALFAGKGREETCMTEERREHCLLLARLADEIGDALAAGNLCSSSLYWISEFGDGKPGKPSPTGIEHWCVGFSFGMNLRWEEWLKLPEETYAIGLLPIILGTGAKEPFRKIPRQMIDPIAKRLHIVIPDAVLILHRYWGKRRAADRKRDAAELHIC